MKRAYPPEHPTSSKEHVYVQDPCAHTHSRSQKSYHVTHVTSVLMHFCTLYRCS